MQETLPLNETMSMENSANPNLILLFSFHVSGKNFSTPACRRRVLNIVLPQEVDPDSGCSIRSEEEHGILIGSLIDLTSNAGVRAVGGLLQD